jgi:hypothetical protein
MSDERYRVSAGLTEGRKQQRFRRPMKNRDEHIDFLKRNSVRIAACAYEGHKTQGRGLVVVDADSHDEVAGTVGFTFLPERLVSKMICPFYGTREARMVSGYDPEMEVVVAFIRTGEKGAVDCYRLKTDPSPKAAAEVE